MAKKYNYNSDWMSRQMDEKLEQMEDRLSSIYANASYDVNAEFAKFAKTFEKEDKQKYAEMQEGVISKEEYSLWRQRHILQTDLYKATVDKITGTLVNTDVVAMALVNGELPSVVSQSYNFVQSLGWKEADESGLSVGTFQIYNADAVQTILKDNPDLLPVVDVPEDKKWNKEKINDTIASSIIKGDPIDKVAENLQKVANMDHNSAVRNARTAMTGAENLGRTQSASDLKAKGIPMDEVWSATYDDRVRESHLMLDGTKRDENGVFGADFLSTPLRYPADPNGDPEEIYNCRCRLNVVLAGIDHSQDDDLYEQFMKENYAESWQKMQENEGYKEKERQKEDALARKERLLEQKAEKQAQEQSNVPLEVEQKAEGYKDANDLERAIVESGGGFDDPRLLAYSEALEAEQSYTTSLKNNLEQAISENGYTNGIKIAIEEEEKDAQRTLDNMPEMKTPEQIAQEEALKDRLDMLSGLKPDEPVVPDEKAGSTQMPVMPDSVRTAYDKFEDKYMESKSEHGMLFSADGQLLGESTSSRRGSVSIASESIYKDMGAGGFEIHNHPHEEMFSPQDISNYERYGINGTITTPTGMEYTLYNLNEPRWEIYGSDTKYLEWIASPDYVPSLAGEWGTALEDVGGQWIQERRDFIDSIQELDRSTQREKLREWEEANPRMARYEQWFEENAEKYGFIFEKKNID